MLLLLLLVGVLIVIGILECTLSSIVVLSEANVRIGDVRGEGIPVEVHLDIGMSISHIGKTIHDVLETTEEIVEVNVHSLHSLVDSSTYVKLKVGCL